MLISLSCLVVVLCRPGARGLLAPGLSSTDWPQHPRMSGRERTVWNPIDGRGGEVPGIDGPTTKPRWAVQQRTKRQKKNSQPAAHVRSNE